MSESKDWHDQYHPMRRPLDEDAFLDMTRYVNAGDNYYDNVARGLALGFEPTNIKVGVGAIIRIPQSQMGKNCHIGLYCYVNGDVTIGDNTLVGPHTTIAAGNHKFDPATGWFSARSEKDGDDSIVIGPGCWIASNCVITAGVKMGKCNMVCAGAVVTHSTPDYAIMAGCPAKQIGEINPETGEYIWFGHQKKAEEE